MKKLKIDKFFLASVILLTAAGFLIFSSASLGLLARDGASFQSVAMKQTLSLILGALAFFIASKIKYEKVRKYAFYIFIIAIALNLLLFIPAITFTHGGAGRWIDLKFMNFQPSEFLKIAFVIYFAAWLSQVKDKVKTFRQGILPYIIIISILAVLLRSQSDMDTLIVIAFTGIIMLFAAGARIRHVIYMLLIMIVFVTGYAYFHPYARERIMTFLNPSADYQGAGYQLRQSLIAIGSGGLSGRGFGQSVQKFNYLPEPIGDSIFAVQAEEFGFIGSVALILLFIFFLFKSFKIASLSPDIFSSLSVIGIATLIVVESFMNISSMIGLIPLSGMPLLFVSHGGTALVIVLGAVGIIANISKYQKG